MSLDLLNELEKRVQSAVGTIESLKAEIEQLKEENAELSAEKDAWGGRLSELLGKFDLIGSADDAVSDAGTESFNSDADSELDDEAGLEIDDSLELNVSLESLDDNGAELEGASHSLEDDLDDLGFAEDDAELSFDGDDAEGEAEETLANQAFEQDFAEMTDDTEDGTLKNSGGY